MEMNSDSELPPATYVAHAGQTSHIPGLSQGDGGPEEKGRGRRVGVLETDSPYVKLSKQGGLKDLLCQEEEEVVSKSNSYRPPTWFADDKPSLINNEEKRDTGTVQQRHAPFGGDNKSVWERNSDDKDKQDNDPNSQKEGLSTHSHETSKFKKTSFDKKPVPVNMAKLMSFGYADEDEPTKTNSDITVIPSEDLKTGV